MEQRLVLFTHDELKLFYIGSYNNSSIFENSSSLNSNYNRARHIHAKINQGDSPPNIGGFMMALINTSYEGWERIVINEVYADPQSASLAKMAMIERIEENNVWQFVGRERAYVKGEYGKSKIDHSWNRKFNVAAMKLAKIRDKVEFIVKSLGDVHIPNKIHNDAYMAVIGNPAYTPRGKNFGSYEVDSLGNLFRYVRNYLGFDLDYNVDAA